MKRNILSKILAVSGTVLVWFPILAPLLLGVIGSVARGELHIDYLMPAELFPLALVGGGLLTWAALRERHYRRLMTISLGAAVLTLVGSQAIAVVTGLASGETEPGGWQMGLVIGGLAVYVLAVIAIGIGGISLLRYLFKPTPSESLPG